MGLFMEGVMAQWKSISLACKRTQLQHLGISSSKDQVVSDVKDLILRPQIAAASQY